ncbi:hypothetical protein ACFFNX_47650, partial [Actinoallomurus acaciae]
ARAAHFRPLFEAAPRDAASWRRLLDGDGLDPADARALIVRREFDDGRVWGTTSISLTTLGVDAMTGYDFTAAPGDPAAWRPVPLP